MTVSSASKTYLVVFSCFPVVVKLSKPFVNLEIMKSDVCDDLLLKS
jgi:hypothetical protein